SEQRRAAVNFRVEAPFDVSESVLGEQCPKLAAGIRRELIFEHRKDAHRQAFASFQDDIPHEAVADDDIRTVLEQAVAFDITDEVEVQFLAKFEGLEGQLNAFALFGANTEDADARAFAAQNLARI